MMTAHNDNLEEAEAENLLKNKESDLASSNNYNNGKNNKKKKIMKKVIIENVNKYTFRSISIEVILFVLFGVGLMLLFYKYYD